MGNKIIICLLFLSLLNFLPEDLSAQLSKENLAYQYHPGAEIRLKHRLAVTSDQIIIYLKINTLEGVDFSENYELSYGNVSQYEEEVIFSDSVTEDNLVEYNRNKYVYKLEIPFQGKSQNRIFVFQVRNKNTENKYLFDVPVSTETDFPKPSFMLMQKNSELPVWENYINENDTFRIVDLEGSGQPLYGYYYQTDFSPSEPPMAALSQNIQEKINIDSVFSFSSGSSFNFDQLGLFFIQKDTNSFTGLSFRTENMFFPRFARVDNVIEPLIYITTKGERSRLMGAENQKKALDKFWLDIARTPQRAKSIIKFYFNRLEQANQFFTTYKEGWKTDQGMIYAIYGPPSRVTRTDEEELWIYDKTDELPKLAFTFVKVKNLFHPQHYSLIKDEDYELFWHKAIDLLRKGRMNI